LAPFVRTFTVVEASEETTRLLIPATGIVLGLRYGGSATLLNGDAARMPDASVTGLRAEARRMRTSAGGGAIFAMFHEGGAAPFFDLPLHELFDETVPLGDLTPADEIDRAREGIANATDDAERVSIIEEFLFARYQRRQAKGDAVVAEAVRAIRAARGTVRIGSLAETLGIGQDRLEKRFRAAVGTSPKQLASLIRLHRAIAAYRPGTSLASLSAEAGYFDQSHFTRELRAVTGDPPQRFFRAATEHC